MLTGCLKYNRKKRNSDCESKVVNCAFLVSSVRFSSARAFCCFPLTGWIKAGTEIRCWELSSGWVTVSLPEVTAEASFSEQSQFHENNSFTFVNNRDYWQSVNQPGSLLDKKRYAGEPHVYEKCNCLEIEGKDFAPFETHTIYPNGDLHPGVPQMRAHWNAWSQPSGRDFPCEKHEEQKELLQQKSLSLAGSQSRMKPM